MNQIGQMVGVFVLIILSISYLVSHFIRSRRRSSCSCCPLKAMTTGGNKKPST